MEAKTKRKIKSGLEYDHLFPVADLNEVTVKKGATVSDTVKFIPKVVNETLGQTKKIAELLRGNSVPETCRNIWHFVYEHIAYHKDADGLEQIRSPARTWHDRHRGVDCDCYTVFISSILTNLKIPHSLRIARYKQDYFQHIYPIVPRANGKHITIDCVVNHYNYEEPYTEIKDTPMDLHYLSGTENEDGLGRKKLKDILREGLHFANRVNPATILLRNGVLASMKLNIFKIAQRLKWAYLSDEDAKKKGIDMEKLQHLKKIKDKLEQIYYGAGGKPENFKKAILKGKGNKHHEVNGLGEEFRPDENVFGMHEGTPLSQLLGEEMYRSENVEGMEELGALGEPVTAASITAATGALAAIAGLLKSVGNIFHKKSGEGSKDFENTDKGDDGKNLPADTNADSKNTDATTTDKTEKTSAEKTATDNSATDDSTSSNTDDGSTKKGFWDKNKKWLKPTLWGAGGLGLLYVGYRVVTGQKKENPAEQNQPVKQLSGTKKKKYSHKKKDEVALM